MSYSPPLKPTEIAEKRAILEDFTSGMYARVTAEWKRSQPMLRQHGDWGFAILSSPARFRPTMMILGENPGFGKDDDGPHEDSLPSENSYIDADWRLARILRQLFADAGITEMLHGAVIANFQFFKSPNLRDWAKISPPLRRNLEAASLREIEQLVYLTEPQQIMVLGLKAFDKHAKNHVIQFFLDESGRRRLLVTGSVYGRPAFGLMHPSGSRVSSPDWKHVSEWMRVTAASTTRQNESPA